MEHSPTVTEIAPALIAARSEFPPIRADSIAAMQTKAGDREYKYADLNDIVMKVQPVLAKYQIMVLQSSVPEGSGLLVTTELLHKSGEWIRTTVFVGSNPRASGSQNTFGRRYGLAGSLWIVPDKDDDGAGAEDEARERLNKEFVDLTSDSDKDEVAKYLESLDVTKFSELDDQLAAAVVKKIRLKKADADVQL